MLRIALRQIGAKAWFDFSTFLAEELGFEACRLNPCFPRRKKAVLLVHVKGDSKYIMKECAPKLRSKFDASLSTMTKIGKKTSEAGRWHFDQAWALHREHAGSFRRRARTFLWIWT